MKILFICRSNAERSLSAEILFKHFSKKNTAFSAGINVEKEGATGAPAGRIVTELLLSMGYDEILGAKRRQLTKRMSKNADKIIVIMNKAEMDKFGLPKYIKGSAKTTYWDGRFNNIPQKIYLSFPPSTYKFHLDMLKGIMNKVDKLTKEIG